MLCNSGEDPEFLREVAHGGGGVIKIGLVGGVPLETQHTYPYLHVLRVILAGEVLISKV